MSYRWGESQTFETKKVYALKREENEPLKVHEWGPGGGKLFFLD